MFTFLQILAFILLLLLLLTFSWWYFSIPSNLPPGPIGLPFLGSMVDIWNPDTLYTKLDGWSKVYGPLYKLYVADQLVVVLADMRTLQEALVKQGDIYAGRPRGFFLISEDMQNKLGVKMAPADQVWKERRRFTLSTMRNFVLGKPNFESMIKEEVEKVLDIIGEHRGRPFDPDDLLHSGVTNCSCGLILGKRFDYEHPDFVDLLALMHSLLEENNVSPLSPFIIVDRVAPFIANSSEMKKVRDKFLRFLLFLKREIAQLRSEFNYDQEPISMVQAYFKVQQDLGADSVFNDGLLLDAALSLFFGGDAVANNTRWAILYLCRNPQLQEEIYQEILTQTGSSSVPSNADRVKLPLTEAAIMEVLRASGQHLGVLRRTVSPSKLFGYDIPQDTIVVSLLGACLLDPNVFPNPREFDHKRFLENGNNKEEHKKRLAHFLPFQLGKRSCPGESVTRTETFLFFTGLVTRYQLSFSPSEPPIKPDKETKMIGIPVNFKICAKARTD